MKGIFVTGTGTGVGKTIVTAGLARIMRRAGTDAIPMKPFQTGCPDLMPDGSPQPPDLMFALKISGYQPAAGEFADMCPYRYSLAASPHLAARQAGESPSVATVRQAAANLAGQHELIIAEGAGGVLVPVNDNQTMLDLMQSLKWPVILTTYGGLGTLNATLLSLRVLRDAGLSVIGVVICDTQPVEPDPVYEDNPATLAKFGHCPILARIPWLGNDLSAEPVWRRFSACFNPPIVKIMDEFC